MLLIDSGMLMIRPYRTLALVALLSCVSLSLRAQPYGDPDRDAPGDAMIQAYLTAEAARIHGSFTNDLQSLEAWADGRQANRKDYLYMLGLWPFPERTPLRTTVTGTLEGEGYVVDMIHFQSRPQLYVTGNLYRPVSAPAGQPLPAVLYVCGHSYQGRSGNKTAYQSHGIWFARHGYICLVLDSLQLGEIGALHHGTYRENRWWWHSRGYTPAGVECLNGIRAIDLLQTRPDVDPNRIAVTGISGGGAATFWIAAADDRVSVAVPVSGMADLPSYVGNRVVNGHCDCMFLYNTFQWPWTRIASLIAPRPLLFTNSDADPIFPMDANERVINRLERLYSLYGRTDLVDAVVSIGGHAYRQDIRQAAYRFLNMHLKDDPHLVDDSEIDLVTGNRDNRSYPVAIDRLRVFPTDSDLPKEELNTTIDEHFVPKAQVALPTAASFETWKTHLLSELRRVTFRTFPERIPPARLRPQDRPDGPQLEAESGIRVRLLQVTHGASIGDSNRILLGVQGAGETNRTLDLLRQLVQPGDTLYLCEPRGTGPTRWTQKNPPNFVERSHALLGQTVDTGRVRDIVATSRAIRERQDGDRPLVLVGANAGGLLAAYAALWEPSVDGVILKNPPRSHMDPAAPQFLNVLRVCDVPEILGLLAPRPLTIIEDSGQTLSKTTAIYEAAGAREALVQKTFP
jgi:dienelactone hydrolase